MTHVSTVDDQASLLAHLLRVLRTATLQRLILPEVEGKEIDERILLESHLVRTPPLPLAAPRLPLV